MGRRGEHGVALPTPVVVLTAISLVAALVSFFLGPTADTEPTVERPQSSQSDQTAEPDDNLAPSEEDAGGQPPAEPIKRAKIKVKVLNATSIDGLASRVSDRIKRRGWRVLQPANSLIRPARSTVYYSPGLKRAAQLLARDLGLKNVERSRPSMAKGRLIVVLRGPLG